MAFKNFPSPHCHSAASLDTASTPEAFAAWELAHETGALCVTDHGTLGGARKVYDIATGKKFKGKITPILGLESYFRDDNCPILKEFGVESATRYRNLTEREVISPEKYAGLESKEQQAYEPVQTFIDYQKYFHLTMHFQDQAAYEKGVRVLSFADARAEKHGKETKPLFDWDQLQEIGSQNVTFTSSCLIGMIQRHIAFGGRFDIAEAYYKRLRECVKPGNFFVEVFPHVCDRNWDSQFFLDFEDGTSRGFTKQKNLRTDRSYGNKNGGVHAEKLYDSWGRNPEGHGYLRAVMEDRKWVEEVEPKKIVAVRLEEKFLLNECTAISPNGDLQEPCNKFVMAMAQKYGDKILISDDSHFTVPDEKVIQDVKLMQSGDWRFHTSYHRMTSEEAWIHFRDVSGVDQKTFEGWIDNGIEWRDSFKNFKFAPRKTLPTSFYPNDTLTHTMRLIQKHGRQFVLSNPVYWARLQAEIRLLHDNGVIDLLPYFMIDEEVCDLYQNAGELTGPGRGSAAGMLLAYLLEITHVDPLKFGLSMDRFLTKDRIETGKYPDIDQDLPHRHLLVDPKDEAKGWLAERFGDCVVQISTDMSMKLKSAALTVARILAPDRRVPENAAKLIHQFPDAPMGISEHDWVFGYKDGEDPIPGALETEETVAEYVRQFPREWAIVQKCLGIPNGKSRHACAYVIADEPIHNFIPTMTISGVRVTQPVAAQVESSGGLKMDFLVVNSLKDIGACLRLIQNRTTQVFDRSPSVIIDGKRVPAIRVLPHKGKVHDVWDLPEDVAVFNKICEGDTEAVFQLGTPGAMKWLRNFNYPRGNTGGKALQSIEDLSAFTALDRPGPLDAFVTDPVTGNAHNMLVEFARRARGETPIGSFPILAKLFPETYGVLVYQEQIQKAFQEIGNTTGIEANNFRIHVSKKQPMEIMKDKELFMPAAIQKIGKDAAEQLWASMETFGAYGFNKSHAICYVVIGYACAFLKHHYPLEWWTGVLRNAKKKEIEEKFWRHVGHLMDMPDLALSGDQFDIVNERIRAPLTLLLGIGPMAHQEICTYRPVKTVEELCQKIEDRRVAQGTTSTTVLKSGKVKTKIKKARTAINSKVINTMIVSGAMDSLFPAGLSLVEKLQHYINVNARLTGDVWKTDKQGKRGLPKKSVKGGYLDLTALQQYQLKKEVLPSYSENLFPLALSSIPTSQVRVNGGVYQFRHDDHWLGVETAAGLYLWDSLSPWPPGQNVYVAVPAFVLTCEKRNYQGDKEMLKVLLDIEGTRWELVKWPDRKTGKLPAAMKRDLTGSVVMVVMSKWTEKKTFAIEDMQTLAPKLDISDPEEESPEGDAE